MGCFGPDKPDKRDYYQETAGTLNAQVDLYPDMLDAERQFGLQDTALNLRNLQGYLMGTPEQQREVEKQMSGYRNVHTGERVTELPSGAQMYDEGRGGSWLLGTHGGLLGLGGKKASGDWEAASWMDTETVTDPAQMGLMDLYGEMQPQLSEIEARSNAITRAADIADVTALGPQAVEAIRNANPEQAALMDEMNRQAQQDLALGGRMTPDQRNAMMNSRMGQRSAQGWGYNPGDMAQATMDATMQSEQIKARRRGFAQQAVQQNQAIYGDPFMQILGRRGQTFGAMGGVMGQGQGGQTGQLFNPESAYAGGVYQSRSDTDNMFAAMQPSTMDVVGDISNMAGSFIGSVAGAGI